MQNIPEYKLPLCFFYVHDANKQSISPITVDKLKNAKRVKISESINQTADVSTSQQKKKISVSSSQCHPNLFRDLVTDVVLLIKVIFKGTLE